MSETVDLGAFDFANNIVLQNIISPVNSGYSLSGQSKIAQRYLVFLLTEVGSLTYSPNAGSSFIPTLKYGAISGERDIYVAFAAASSQVGQQMRQAALSTDSPDETFVSADLVFVTVSFGFVYMNIVLTTAGGSLTISWPLSFKVQ